MFTFADDSSWLSWLKVKDATDDLTFYDTRYDATRFKKPHLSSLLTHDSQKAHSRTMMTLSSDSPLFMSVPKLTLVEIPHTLKRRN